VLLILSLESCLSFEHIVQSHRKTFEFGDIPLNIVHVSNSKRRWTTQGLCMPSEPLHTWDWEHVTITFQSLSLVEKVEPIQVHFTLSLRDQRSKWMQDGCKVYMDSYMASNLSYSILTWNMILFYVCIHFECSHPLIYSNLSCMHNFIQSHNNVMPEWQYYEEYSSHLDWRWGISNGILSIPRNIVMALNNIM
jgi:hypothetical protein